MSKVSLLLFGSPLADIQSRAIRRITVGTVGAVLAVLLLVLVNTLVPIPDRWGWVPVAVVLLFSLWCLWHLAVGMHLAAQWLGIIKERPVRFGAPPAATEADTTEADAANALALTDADDDGRRSIAASEGPRRAGTERWRQPEAQGGTTRPPRTGPPPDSPVSPTVADPGDTRAMSADEHRHAAARGPADDDAANPEPPLNRRVVRKLNQKADDETVDEDA